VEVRGYGLEDGLAAASLQAAMGHSLKLEFQELFGLPKQQATHEFCSWIANALAGC
jgi:hypothetical protein